MAGPFSIFFPSFRLLFSFSEGTFASSGFPPRRDREEDDRPKKKKKERILPRLVHSQKRAFHVSSVGFFFVCARERVRALCL
jgi:hypothetical protein